MRLRMKLTAISAALLLLVLAGCGNGGSGGSGDAAGNAGVKGDAVKGREVFMDTCASCHGTDGRGLAGLGKDVVKQSDWMKKQNDAALVAFIAKGRTASDPENTTKVDMPPKGGNPSLTDEDLANVVAYIRSVQQK